VISLVIRSLVKKNLAVRLFLLNYYHEEYSMVSGPLIRAQGAGMKGLLPCSGNFFRSAGKFLLKNNSRDTE
jgi:hypothetical protein